MSYFTAGPEETRAWSDPEGLARAGRRGDPHDFERGFIKAEVIRYEDSCSSTASEAAARAKGALRIEGKEYVVQDGDVMHFMFNV